MNEVNGERGRGLEVSREDIVVASIDQYSRWGHAEHWFISAELDWDYCSLGEWFLKRTNLTVQ